jgi:hypothetical protein
VSKAIYFIPKNSEEKESRSYFQIEDDILEKINTIIKKENENFPLTWKMVHDFYADCFFVNEDLEKLSKEFALIKNKIPENEKFWIGVLEQIAHVAYRENWRLDIIAD